MVRAILENRKKMTRRVIHPDISNWFDVCKVDGAIAWQEQETGDFYPPTHRARYQVGDILYVRETWLKSGNHYYYRASDNHENMANLRINVKWKPSIHMPKKAARIFLRVTDVKAERLWDITESDAGKEGFHLDMARLSNKDRYYKYWDELNAKRGYGWETNPWVWVYTFERVEKQEGE